MTNLGSLFLVQFSAFLLACLGYGCVDLGTGGRGISYRISQIILGFFALLLFQQSGWRFLIFVVPGFLVALLIIIPLGRWIEKAPRPLLWAGIATEIASLAGTAWYSSTVLYR